MGQREAGWLDPADVRRHAITTRTRWRQLPARVVNLPEKIVAKIRTDWAVFQSPREPRKVPQLTNLHQST
ncbi:hypothetical protein THTE_2021 [Thermogutta terrifontis]|uniref:Uncharacterized protein n=1 Tax=Thermogutta terrifontis TaxID=1331910 RepID=A0A286RF94_9BACT|nr:hypothetical protein THTE_2021 [Thermogutta terrifontis]